MHIHHTYAGTYVHVHIHTWAHTPRDKWNRTIKPHTIKWGRPPCTLNGKIRKKKKITRQRLLTYDSQMRKARGTANSDPSSHVRERSKLRVEKPQASYDMLSTAPCKTEGNNPLRNTQNSSETEGSSRVGLAHLFRTVGGGGGGTLAGALLNGWLKQLGIPGWVIVLAAAVLQTHLVWIGKSAAVLVGWGAASLLSNGSVWKGWRKDETVVMKNG